MTSYQLAYLRRRYGLTELQARTLAPFIFGGAAHD